ncbi:phage protease [Sphingobium cloacae]|uniref:Mu-like prophage I protein n=1 Tax=Sphingobium cloacae TaxID=120107 RepID=A0A1E1F2U8_9SPHN|nr:phage protease [Sphingobium cloacae]BAV64771.1 Mu-like prophage I protein [Sphingobium cloacae]
MTKPSTSIALCSAIALADAADAPEWIHLIPGAEIRTHDGRGPYRVTDMVALMANSLRDGDKLVLDENHATDLAAPRGEEAPARGWIVELQQRADGVWGRVEWTEAGRQKVKGKEYRGVSPVIGHRKDGTVTHILRASLVNQPNFQGLTALHQEKHMDFRAKLIEALGLDSEADDAAIIAALTAKLEKKGDDDKVALQSALGPIAMAVGLAATADATAVLAGVEKLKEDGGADGRVVALQSELAGVVGQLNGLRDERARDKAEGFVDAAIAAGRVGIKPLRDDYVSLHMENPERTEKQINAMPIVKGGATLTTSPGASAADTSDDPVQIAAHAAVYQKKQADAGITIDFAAAVAAVQEGRHK